MSAYSETVNVIMKSRVRESRTHGSVRGWHREVPVYSTADRMAAKGGIKKKDAMKGLNLFIETLMDCMSENEKVKLLNFGSFQMKTVKERTGRNPQTGQQCIIPEHEKIKFVASEGLVDRIKNQ